MDLRVGDAHDLAGSGRADTVAVGFTLCSVELACSSFGGSSSRAGSCCMRSTGRRRNGTGPLGLGSEG